MGGDILGSLVQVNAVDLIAICHESVAISNSNSWVDLSLVLVFLVGSIVTVTGVPKPEGCASHTTLISHGSCWGW